MTHSRSAVSLAAACLLGAVVACAAPRAATAQAPTVVLIVRHAEKAAEPADDPPLTPAGAARAHALAAALASARVQAVITTQFARTRDTGRPTADAQHVVMETVLTGRTIADHAARVAAAVRAHSGQTVLVVGHSNTVTHIVEALGGPRLPDLCDSEYSTLFTLVLDGPRARLVTSTYGVASPRPPTGCSSMK